MFEPKAALDACKAIFNREGVNIDVLRLPSTMAAFFDFYRDERAVGCEIADDVDMLLFEWGTYDWGEGEHFELSLSRQLIFGEDDAKVWQLKLTYAYDPTDAVRTLGNGNKWCATPDDLDEFRQDVVRSASYEAVAAAAEIGNVSIGYYRAG